MLAEVLPREQGPVERALDGEDAQHVSPGNRGAGDTQEERVAAAHVDHGDLGPVGVRVEDARLAKASREVARDGVWLLGCPLVCAPLGVLDRPHEAFETRYGIACLAQLAGEPLHVDGLGRGLEGGGGMCLFRGLCRCGSV